VSEDESVESLSVGEAAEVLGVTRDAIHKRINRGTIRHERGADGRYYVFVDSSTLGLDASRDKSRDKSKVEVLERLIARLEHELGEEREARRRADTILAQLARANEEQARTIRALEGPQEPSESPVSRGPSEEGLRTPTDASREPQQATEHPDSKAPRRWWRRMFLVIVGLVVAGFVVGVMGSRFFLILTFGP
jgi:excisionase family DNA binding protein